MIHIHDSCRSAFARKHSLCRSEIQQRDAVRCFVFMAVFLVAACTGAQVRAADAAPSASHSGDLAAAAEAVQRISAHRGSSHDRPENTISAIERAIEAGATAVEIDVRTSRDGKLVIMHDAKVDRTTSGSGRVNDLTWAELAALDAGTWFGAEYHSQRVLSLDQALQVCRGRIAVQLDLKEEGVVFADRIVAALRAHGEPARTISAVRTVEQSRQLKERLPEMKTLIFLRQKKQVDAFLAANLDYLRPQIDWIEEDPTLLRRIRETGAKIHFDATTGTPEIVLPLLKYHPESLLCDDPGQLVKTLDQLRAKNQPGNRNAQE
ncbi:Glycerophosphoryl diester phosphodiesterase [Rubripirellula lacrimiformis]|uniref:Glycerophosphoryl diester phosphodiesterase n=1 Tax=Rubripirellula lacrimiformis TaxID=1930273 RepID=A0A517NEF6_9BACT|nr:glycerophosphodiester phosphodiesterase family protein [Rubripirellula lacrimiformis]QDT05514.1 Glycerophosphoryl diester phosphodiesterase [Rubripirellula lacrimiformis]